MDQEKIQRAEQWLREQKYMPSMSKFKKQHDLSLEEIREIVARNSDINVRMSVDKVYDPKPLPEPTPKWDEVFEKVSNADIKGIFRRKSAALVSLLVSEMIEHLEAAGTNGIQMTGPIDLGECLSSEYPEFYFMAEVKKKSEANSDNGKKRILYEYQIEGEWRVEK